MKKRAYRSMLYYVQEHDWEGLESALKEFDDVIDTEDAERVVLLVKFGKMLDYMTRWVENVLEAKV